MTSSHVMGTGMRLGSLFDGIGGFCWAGQLEGFTPIWASEIESAPISITKRHFPDMVHLGDITKIDGAQIDPVDVITFGSPCQDLSIAGKRDGLDGERSGLFMEAIRIIKEMREKTDGQYPTFIVWENVPGAFSSNKGNDFRTVLEEIACIYAPGVSIPRPSGEGNWIPAGAILGDGYSLAWRVLDAQYWGVPQRRKRIFLVADFRGERAGEILFERESVSRDSSKSREEGEEIAGNVTECVDETSYLCCGFLGGVSSQQSFQCEDELSPTMRSQHGGNTPMVICAATQQGGAEICEDLCPTITAAAGMSGNNQPYICAAFMGGQGAKAGSIGYAEELAPTLKATESGTNTVPSVVYDARGNGDGHVCPTMTGDHNGHISDYTAVAIDCRSHSVNKELSATIQAKSTSGYSLNFINPVCISHQDKTGTLSSGAHPGSYNGQDAYNDMFATNDYIVRRLTPTECERLQGFTDGWTERGHDGKKISDTQRYKALGNSVAIPCVRFVLSRIAEQFEIARRTK